MKILPLILFLTLSVLYSCASQHALEGVRDVDAETEAGCETIANVRGICGFPAPEDIDVLPGGKHLLFSPVSMMNGGKLQGLHLFNIATEQVTPITYRQSEVGDQSWGEVACDTAPGEKFSPHGVHVSQRADGAWQLLAVNHVRESLEMYEVIVGEEPVLAWKGCVLAPPKSDINDVVALPSGGFLVTHMVDKGAMTVMEAMTAKHNTGYVWRWTPKKGFDKLPGSDGIVPNGIALSADGQSVFISETGAQRIRKISYLTGEEQGSLATGPVDNLSWAADGHLIATTITGAVPEDCFSKPGPCLTPFRVISIDPDTLDFVVLHQQNGKPMGMASVAVVHDGSIYIGSFKGRQILKVHSVDGG